MEGRYVQVGDIEEWQWDKPKAEPKKPAPKSTAKKTTKRKDDKK